MKMKRAAIGGALLVIAIGLAGISDSQSAQGASPGKGSSVSGGIATYAEAPSSAPNFIFPFMTSAYFSTVNSQQFQYLMYRPLYFFGANGHPTITPSLSLAYPPAFSNGNRTVTVVLKNYRWSDGENVTSQDVVFWMNMMKTEKLLWAAYVPGAIPDDVASITTPNSKTVVFHLTGPVNRTWWTYNELSQITPLPMAWDVKSLQQKPGKQPCGRASFQSVLIRERFVGTASVAVTPENAVARSCAGVFNYLSIQSGFNPTTPKIAINVYATFATSKLWRVVDGPWHLVAFQSNGYAVFKPNPEYAGPIKPKLAEFVEMPYASASDEFNALVGGGVDVGYLLPDKINSNGKGARDPDANNPQLRASFHLEKAALWQINYLPLNLHSTDDHGWAGKLLSKLYLRQAMQMLVNQPRLINELFDGYGYPTYGPVPIYAKNSFASSYEKSNPFPYDPKRAVALLKKDGWAIHPGGTDICKVAARCGVPKGTPLSFRLQYATGDNALQFEVELESLAWQSVGINVTLSYGTFAIVTGSTVRCSGASCTWDIEDWGGGWVYAPDYYPTGESLFSSNATTNAGSYSNKPMDTLIKKTLSTSTSLDSWENYTTAQNPVIWQPVQSPVIEVAKDLRGALPIDPLGNITPENWYFTK